MNHFTSLCFVLQEDAPEADPPAPPPAAQADQEVPPVRVKPEPEEVEAAPQLPGDLSTSVPAVTGGTTGEGALGGQPLRRRRWRPPQSSPPLRM